MKYLGFCMNNFQTQAHPGSVWGSKSGICKMHTELNFQFTTDMLWENESYF